MSWWRPGSARAAVLAAAWVLAAAVPASADDRQAAAEIFRAASSAYLQGKYRAAALSFEAAFRVAPLGAAAHNAGLAWEQAGEPARAADAFDKAVASSDLGASERDDAKTKLERLEASLGRVDVSGPEGAVVTVAHADKLPLPARVHVAAGEYDVRVTFADGRSVVRHVSVRAATPVSLDVAPTAPQPPSPPSARPAAEPAAPSGGGANVQAILGWSAVGGAALAAGAAGLAWAAANDARDEYLAQGALDHTLYDRADAMRTWTNVAWIGCGLLAVTGATLLLTAPRRSASGSKPNRSARGATIARSGVSFDTPW